MRRAYLLLSLLAAACSSSTTTGGPASGPASGTGTPSDPNADPAAACTAREAAVIASAEALGTPALDFSDTHLAFGYVDATSVPTVLASELASDGATTAKWAAAKAASSHYGSGYIHTSLAHQGDRFGFAWYSERTTTLAQGDGGVWAVRFATMSASDGSTSPATYASPERGRHDTTDLVQAIDPVVAAASDGFFVSWRDIRTAEPTVMGVNIAGWSGVYGQAFDANGDAIDADVQVVQPAVGTWMQGVESGGRLTMFWAGNGDANDKQLFLRSVGGTAFTPAKKPTPFATVKSFDSTAFAVATGAGGHTLVVVTSHDEAGDHIGSVVLDGSGAVIAKYRAWGETDLTTPAVAATTDGFVVAATERAQAGSVDAKVKAIRYFFLDAAGSRVAEARADLPWIDRVPTALSVRANAAGGAYAAVALGPATRQNAANHFDVVLSAVCPTAK